MDPAAQVHLPQLADQCCRLLAALNEQTGAPDKARAAVEAVQLRCAQCGNRLKPAEIIELAQASNQPPSSNPRVARLQQGYCPRADCSSYYYRIELQPVPGLDWSGVLARVETVTGLQGERSGGEDAVTAAARWASGLRWSAKVAAVLGGLAVLMLLRQWYIGGTIPLLREPQVFQVDPTSLDRPVPP